MVVAFLTMLESSFSFAVVTVSLPKLDATKCSRQEMSIQLIFLFRGTTQLLTVAFEFL